ncbi:MAG TPA: glycosyltransferase family 4 protein [Polyangia bacterium]|jgi:glycosyltransferase involved in cell wall biosynthesis
MRVLYLNPFSQEVSGPDESLRALLAALIPAGVEAHVVLPAPGPQVDRYRALGARTHFLPLATLRRALSPTTALYAAQLARSAVAVGRLARAVGADVIHTNMEVLLEGGLAARARAIPHVLHYRGNTLDRPKLVFDALAAMWTATADHIFCISRATAGIFERRGRARKVEVLYNPIDVRAFGDAARSADVRGALGAAPDRLLVGTVGRIHPRKDLETFIRAAALVAARRADVHFAVVGAAEAPVERDYEASLRALVRELSLERRVTFAGARRDMPAVMAALDVFVLTSRHEGFGRVVAEAMAGGRPVIVTDEGAPPELVDPERCGLAARPGDPADFARQILRQIEDRAGAQERARRARERARTFDAVDTARRVRAVYERLAPTPART